MFGFLASVISIVSGITRFLVDHADDAARVIGFFGAVFGFIAGYYTMRIQRRAWRRSLSKTAVRQDGESP